MTRERDFYLVLGVSPSATGDEIRLAYRELVKKHHPDNCYSYIEKNRANLTMQEINAAYEVLGNPNKRSEYDHNEKRQLVIFKQKMRSRKIPAIIKRFTRERDRASSRHSCGNLRNTHSEHGLYLFRPVPWSYFCCLNWIII
jgi:DnaJ-class molecular chaperone